MMLKEKNIKEYNQNLHETSGQQYNNWWLCIKESKHMTEFIKP